MLTQVLPVHIILLSHERNTMTNHEQIRAAFETYLAENEKFTAKGVKASAARARKALQEMSKGIKERRPIPTRPMPVPVGQVLLPLP